MTRAVTPPASVGRTLLNKVPEVTLLFWVIKIAATTLGETRPSRWALTEPATEKDGVVEGWFAFETAVGRGRGIFRLKDGRCWTLLTTLQELKGFEEKAGGTGERRLYRASVLRIIG